MKVIKYLSYSFLLAFTTFVACTSEVETLDLELLYGRWDIKSAQRDGHPTETLTNTFFDDILCDSHGNNKLPGSAPAPNSRPGENNEFTPQFSFN